jgi:hypothetical protein
VKKEIPYILLSLVTGILLLIGLYSFGYFAAYYDRTHPSAILGGLGYLVISLLTVPLFGAHEESVWLLVGTALFDVWWLSLPIYLLTWMWRHLRNFQH